MNDETKKKFFKTLGKIGLSIGMQITAYEVYSKIFQRVDLPDYNIYPGLFDYQKVKKILPRTTFKFSSNREKLQGYYYEAKTKAKGIVILVHGFHSGSDDYLPITMRLVEKGYDVFSYDGCGTYRSTGKSLNGFLQGLVDLDYAVRYINNSKKYAGKKLFLLGHSCGGFAVNAVLNIHKKFNAVASIAAVNNAYKLLLDKGDEYAGEIASTGFSEEFLDNHQKQIFGKYCKYTALDGVNSVKIPIFIAHGKNDETISYELQSLISKRKQIKNPNVTYVTTSNNQGGHVSIWHSVKSNDYQKEVDSTLKRMKKDKKSHEEVAEYVKTVDHALYSEINYELIDQIIEMFDSTLKK